MYSPCDNSTEITKRYVFNFLAEILCLFSKEKTRSLVSLPEVLTEQKAREYEKSFGRIKKLVDQTAERHYYFTVDEFREAQELVEKYVGEKDYVGILELCKVIDRALGKFEHVFPRIDTYAEFKSKVTVKLDPLNTNYKKTGIEIYPRVLPFWSLHKSVMTRTLDLNRCMTNFWCLQEQNEHGLRIIPYYMKSPVFADKFEKERGLVVALSPICKNVKLKFKRKEENEVRTIGDIEVENMEELLRRMKATLEHALDKGANVIIFPEMLGGDTVENLVREVMERHSCQPVLCVLPSYCKGRCNQVTLLGPNGRKIFTQNKVTPFMPRLDGKDYIEDIELGNEIHVLLVEGLGMVVLPICADLLEGKYEQIIYDHIPANMIICPSFSPGIGAFHETALRGASTYAMTYWLNTCAAEGCGLFEKHYGFHTVAFAQLPGAVRNGEAFCNCDRTCNGVCSENICYFRMKVTYENGRFHANSVHEIA